LALVLLDIGGLGFALAAPVFLAPWATINLMAFVVGILGWSEDRRIQRESATAMQRQAEKSHAAERRNPEECQREAQRKQQAEQAERLRQAEQQLREVEQRRRQEEEEREAQRKQQAEQAERLRQAEQQLREVEQRRRQEEEEREAQRQWQAEQAERLRQRQRERTQAGAQFQADWWIVLGVAPTANKDEIVRNYRRKIKQCHPDRLVGLAPEFLQLAEERTKALNEAYANAMRTRWQSAA
jgi:DnaJ-domain-containing protein 1